MIKDGKKIRLEMIKAISERHKCQVEVVRLRKLVIKMACCGNCGKFYTKTQSCHIGSYPSEYVCKEWILRK